MGSSTSSTKKGVFKGSKNPKIGMASTTAPSTGKGGGKNPCSPHGGKKSY